MPSDPPQTAALPHANVPLPPSERANWVVAVLLALLGALALSSALILGGHSASPRAAQAPPAVPQIAVVPSPAPGALQRAASGAAGSAAIVNQPSSAQQQLDARRFIDPTQTHISKRWMEGFYPIYAVSQRTFGVNWLLLASIHRQESAFSTATGTYHGLNFAHCCGGPMQFNVTNGPLSTWQLVSGSFRYGARPAAYDHQTAAHPSLYDDFDSIMAAAHLLSADGAGYSLDATAWDAAYDYYGHDATGVTYADQVIARAIGWSQHGFCINCGVEPALVEAVNGAYGAPVLAALSKAGATRAPRKRSRRPRSPAR